MQTVDNDPDVIAAARNEFNRRLANFAPVTMTVEQYEVGIRSLSENLQYLCTQVSDVIKREFGQPLTYNQANIALISAMNKKHLIIVK